ELLPAKADDNETGFWEHRAFNLLHEEILCAQDKWWADFRPMPAGWSDRPNMRAYAQRMAAMVTEDFGDAPLIAIKDPRISRLLPLWRQVAARTGHDLRVALIIRHPAAVSESLRRRDGLTLAHGALLWLRYLLDGERESRGLPRAATTYDRLLGDWRQAADDLGRGTGITWPVAADTIAPQVDAFLRDDLRHHGQSALDPAAVAGADFHQNLFHLFNRSAGQGDGFPAAATLDAAADRVELAMTMIEPWLREQDHELAVLRQLLSDQPAHAQAVHAEVTRLRQALESTEARLQRATADAAKNP
ncbi:MAG: sulfotransferase family protein, partial [Thalassobaculaceae bacterium]